MTASPCYGETLLWRAAPQSHSAPRLDGITSVATVVGMAIKLTVRKVGDSLGVVLPKAVLAHLEVGEGRSLYLTEAPDGYRVTAGNAEFARQMAVAEDVTRRYRNALRELAK